ncbi:MAG: VUT family protein, partial [Anaerolineae bacterium]
MGGEFVDTLLFVCIAFGGILPWGLLVSVIVSNYLFKTGLEVVATPVTYAVVRYLKAAEQEDYYDYDTDFSPFRLEG